MEAVRFIEDINVSAPRLPSIGGGSGGSADEESGAKTVCWMI
jgi:hypothetical protein